MVADPKRRKVSKTLDPQRTVRLNAPLPHLVHAKLAVHALMTGRTQTDILVDLIEGNLKDYQVRDMTKSSGRGVAVESAVDVEDIDLVAA